MRSTVTLFTILALAVLIAACGGTDSASENGGNANEAALNDAANNGVNDAVDEAAVEEAPVGEAPVAVDLGEGAVTTESGLQYRDDVVGDGAVAEICDTAMVHYTGRLTNGTQFDSSVDRGEPFQFTVGAGEVIAGWDEGVQGMAVGGQRALAIPPELGYGEMARGAIPANAMLEFDVELLDVTPRPDLPDAPAEAGDFETTESGLQYAVLREGEGEPVDLGSIVFVHYTGWLEDGTMFDSSLKPYPERCGPLAFQIGNGSVIPGWEEGVTGMTVGERRQLVIPSDLAYGDQGQGEIPPGATLTFDVELVGSR